MCVLYLWLLVSVCCVYSVKELSQHFSGLDPVRQKWIYSFFMYPFLSRNTSSGNASPLALDVFVFCEGFVQVWVVWFYIVVVVGCIDPEDSTEDWLMKNFGSFSVMAQVRDFTSINMIFSGVGTLTLASDVILMVIRWHPQLCADVLRFFPVLSAGGLHLLSPEQKAELLLHPEVVGLTDGSLGLVFQSLLSSLMPSENPWPSNNGTAYYMSTVPSASPQDPLGQARIIPVMDADQGWVTLNLEIHFTCRALLQPSSK